jgi:hypothetical protein
VRAVVVAYAEGKIELYEKEEDVPDPKKNPNLRYAPYFAQGGRPGPGRDGQNRKFPYTKEAIKEFLNWDLTRVERTLVRLTMHEKVPETAKITKGMKATAATELVRATKRLTSVDDAPIEVVKKMQKIKKLAADKSSGEDIGRDGVRKAANEVLAAELKGKQPPPDVNRFIQVTLKPYIDRLLGPGDPKTETFKQVVKYQECVEKTQKRDLCKSLRCLIKRCEKIVQGLEK